MNAIHAIKRLRDVIRRQHKALSTESCYVYWLRRYIAALPRMAEATSSEQKVEQFLTRLARHGNVTASTQNQALNAILFFYKEVLHQPIAGIDALRAKRPVHLRQAPTIPETQALLQTIRDEAGYKHGMLQSKNLVGWKHNKKEADFLRELHAAYKASPV